MIDYSTIPDWVREEIDEWAAIATWPGTFVQAVLENQLHEAFGLAQEEQIAVLHSIVAYVYNHVPSPCWRSREKMVAWREMVVEAFEKALAERIDHGQNGADPLGENAHGEIRRALADELIAAQRQRSTASYAG